MALLAVIGIGALSLLCCGGTVAAMVLPSFLRINSRPRSSEAKFNLKAAYTGERAYFLEKDELSKDFESVGFAPERANRYLYVLDPAGGIRLPGDPPGPHGILTADAAR